MTDQLRITDQPSITDQPNATDEPNVEDPAAGRESFSPRSARLGGDREQEILRATYELLAEVGYAGLRLDAVASRAKTSKATLYRHWPGKPQLVADAMRVCSAHGIEPPDTGSLRGDLVALLQMMAGSMTSEDGPIFAGMVMAMLNDPEFAAEMRALQAPKRVASAAIHARAVSRGEVRADSDPYLIDEVAPAQMFMQCFARGEPLDGPFIDHLVDDILLPILTR